MGASTIVVAREDLSIPGAPEVGNGGATTRAASLENTFFNVVRQHNPDVIVLDLTGATANGTATILKIRRRTAVPILVVCDKNDPMMREYCLVGACECMEAPVDVMQLNQTVQQIIQLSKNSHDAVAAPARTQPLYFCGLTLHPHENRLTAADGRMVKLTTSENRVLVHFVSNPWTLCTRDQLVEALYGPHRPNSDRAVDVIVTRLRKKIAEIGEPAAERLIKTEFRRGYVFVAEVSIGAPLAAQPAAAPPLHARTA